MEGLRRQIGPSEIAIVILQRVKLIELAARMHQVTRESHARAVNVGDQGDASQRVPWGRQDEEGVRSPGERLVVLERKRGRQVLADSEEGTAVIVVVRDALLLPVVRRPLE